MKTPHLNARPTICVAAFLAALGLATISARAAAPESTGGAARTTVAAPLQWNFQVGDAFRIHAEAVTLCTDSSNNRYRNEVELVYVWRVNDVAPDGTATLVVTPESVKIDSQLPLAEFDTTRDDPTIAPTEDPTWRAQFFEARAWAQAEFTCRVTNVGQVIGISGALPAAGTFQPIGFTPAGFTRLPGTIVQPGDTWDVAYSHDAGTDGSLPVRARYWLADCWCEADRQILHIEGSITRAKHSVWLGHQSEFGPMISVSHFDPIGGYFLDQITVTSGQVRIGPDEIVTVKVGTNRQVTKVAEPPLATAGSGEQPRTKAIHHRSAADACGGGDLR